MNSASVLYGPGKNDECHTPAYAVRAILPYLDRSKVYWLPFDDNDSEFCKVLRESGFRTIRSHISDGPHHDFYRYEPSIRWHAILSNPPFTNKAEIFRRALSFGKPFALLMALTWLQDAAPKRLFRERPLELLMFEERIRFKGQENKITFSSAYFCSGILPQQICMASLKDYGMKG